VIQRLQPGGYVVDAAPNRLESLDGDAGSIAGLLKTINGPIVLVGHSSGGAAITNAARGVKNVKALVYVDGSPSGGRECVRTDRQVLGSVLTAASSEGVCASPAAGCRDEATPRARSSITR
jgi:pimeloyl-ACP methyl ester carboxylesterase